jgi:quercetin dioxygenase-like cupin family protein
MKKFIDRKSLEKHLMIPGFRGRFIHSEKMTISYWDIESGSKLPEHRHPHEQISQVIKGKFKLTISGESVIMTPGITAIIPSNALHSGEALTECQVMDIFAPVREDYLIS